MPMRIRLDRTPWRLVVVLAGCITCAGSAFFATACSRAPAEPDPSPPVATSAPAVTPLAWEAPPAWTVVDTPRGGSQKAAYRVPKAGGDKEDAEAAVFFFGTGAKGDPEPTLKEWLGLFDGDAASGAKRETLDVRGTKIDWVETQPGTFKVPIGPKVPGKKMPVAMVKEKWRLVVAVVKTPDRGNWFFRLAGPDDTVQAARSAFRAMVESAK